MEMMTGPEAHKRLRQIVTGSTVPERIKGEVEEALGLCTGTDEWADEDPAQLATTILLWPSQVLPRTVRTELVATLFAYQAHLAFEAGRISTMSEDERMTAAMREQIALADAGPMPDSAYVAKLRAIRTRYGLTGAL